VFKDLTEIRELEEEMRRKEWLASLGEMSAGMAHEIRNPLGALAGAMQMLRKDAVEDETNRRLMTLQFGKPPGSTILLLNSFNMHVLRRSILQSMILTKYLPRRSISFNMKREHVQKS